MNSGERVRQLRRELKLTQKEFALRIALTQNHLTGIETGKRTLTERTIALICAEYGVNSAWLREGIGPQYSQVGDESLSYVIRHYQLDGFVKGIVAEYLKLSDAQRNAISRYIQGVVREVDAAQPPR